MKTKTIADLLFARDILLDLATPGKYELFERIGEHMEWVHGIRQRDVFQALAEREHLGSTGMGQGIAIPHARIKELDRIRVTYVRLLPAIDFNAPDGKPVTDVLVILVPKQATEDHLQVLSDTSQIFSDPRFRERLHLCKDPAEVKLLFDVWPETLS